MNDSELQDIRLKVLHKLTPLANDMIQHFESYRQTLLQHLDRILAEIVQKVLASKLAGLGFAPKGKKDEKEEELVPVSAFQQELESQQAQMLLREK